MLKPLALLLAGMLLLSSCSLLDMQQTNTDGDEMNTASSITATADSLEKRSDAMFETILSAIENRDGDTIKALFSEEALEEANDIDAAIEYLFNLFDGEIVSWERDRQGADESFRSGRHSRSIHTWYTVHTETGRYLFLLLDYDINTIDPDLEGLYTLHGINAEYAETQWGNWVELRAPGVYMPEE